ncbi:unnamed protein product [Paramecium octaurelia]|uniref:Uncharacterized protein n=1 Tax=Paramecium octaurelia TaxID=43137 RepID=A0A8S1XYN0_PAROT|nr:unnamed protein product [Paramecium octaurelia]
MLKQISQLINLIHKEILRLDKVKISICVFSFDLLKLLLFFCKHPKSKQKCQKQFWSIMIQQNCIKKFDNDLTPSEKYKHQNPIGQVHTNNIDSKGVFVFSIQIYIFLFGGLQNYPNSAFL